jgi:hypothetical protein
MSRNDRPISDPVPHPLAEGDAWGVPPGILRSQQAFWRELPALLRDRRNRGRWAAYHGDERIGIAVKKAELIQAMLRRGIPRDDYYVGRIWSQTLPPWEPVEVESTHRHPGNEQAPPS